mgnify:CR=1 FL=1
MTINLSDNDPRVSYSVGQGVTQTSFAVPFEFFDNGDLNVYVDGTLKTITTHYTVSGGDGSTGTVAISVTGASGGSTVVITRSIDLDRTTDFPSSGPFNIASLNTELDRMIAINADLQDEVDRSIRLPDFDAEQSMVLPTAANRASKLVSFDSNGALLVDSSSNLNLVLGTVTIGTILGTNDIDLKPAGGQVNILGTSGQQRIQFNNDATPEMLFYQNSNTTTFGVTNPTGSRTINLPDASGTVALTNQNTLSPTGDFTVDASGDVILDADGGEVLFKDAGTTSFTFRVSGAGSRILTSSNLTIESGGSGDIDIKPVGGQVNILGTGGEQRILFNNDTTPTIKYFQNSNTLDLAVDTLDGSRTITLPNATDTLVGKATTDTLTNKTLTSAVLNTGVSGTAILDEDNMSSNSATQLATQQSIKAYVDAQISGGTGDIAGVIAGTGLTGGGTSGTVTLNINATNGLTATSSTLSIDSTVVTLTGSQTLTNKTLTNPTITSAAMTSPAMTGTSTFGGASGVSISQGAISIKNGGAQSYVDFYCESSNAHRARVQAPAHSDFSGDITLTLPATTDTLVGKTTTDTLTNKTLTSAVLNTGVSGTAIKDEDNLASNSATHLATQQSIKAYVDAQVAGGGAGNLSTVLGIGNTTGGNDIVFSAGDKISNASGDFTLDVAGDIILDADGADIIFKDGGTQIGRIRNVSSGEFTFQSDVSDKDIVFNGKDGGSTITALTLDMSDAGSATFNNKVGIGVTPTHKLHVSGTGSVSTRTFATDSGGDASFFAGNDGGQIVGPLVYGSGKAAYGALGTGETALYSNSKLSIMSDNGSGIIKFATGGNTERMRIDSGGTLAVGTTDTHTWNTFDGRIRVGARGCIATTTSSTQVGHNWYYNSGYKYIGSDYASRVVQAGGYVSVETAASGSADGAVSFSERMRIDSSGNMGLNTSSPLSTFHVMDSGATSGSLRVGGNGASLGLELLYDQSGSTTSTIQANPTYTSTTSLMKIRVDGDGNPDQLVLKGNGNVMIGTTTEGHSTANNLTIEDSGHSGITVRSGTSSVGSLFFSDTTSGTGEYIGYIQYDHSANVMKWQVNGSQRMRIDGSGNIMLGTTSTSPVASHVNGALYNPSSGFQVHRDGGAPLALGTDGDNDMLYFRRQGVYVATAGIKSTDNFFIGGYTADHAGLEFATHKIEPLEANSACDGTIDMGSTSARFHTGYFSNGTSSSSDQNEKQNIAELTATELAVSKRLAKTFRTFRRIDAVEAKGDNARTHTGTIAQEVHAAFAAEGLDAAKYGMYMSDTWKDNDDKEITRLGIRYEQLLSFISAGAEQRLTDIETRLAALEG